MKTVDQEVRKFQEKKKKLTQGFVAKITGIISTKKEKVKQVQNTINELQALSSAELADIDRAERALKEI